MYTAVVFDFGNVLCSLERMNFAERAAAHSSLSAEAIDAALWGGRLERDFETGRLDSRAYFSEVKAIACFDPLYSYELFVKDYLSIIQPNPDGEAGLLTAKKLGARTFLLSNTSFLHATTIFTNETLASVPELHILSYKIGRMKPDPEIWIALLRYSGLTAEECLYVDDVAEYCDAAASLGFGTVNYKKNEQNLSQILESVLQ